MSYFRRIADRTLGPGQRSVRPAVTPDSIPESPVERKGAPANRARRHTLSERDIKGPPAPAPEAGNVRKGDLQKNDAQGIEAHGGPEKPQEIHVELPQTTESQRPGRTADKTGDASDLSVTKQPVRPVRVQEQEVPAVQAVKNAPMNESGTESRPVPEISAYDNTEIAPAEKSVASEYVESVIGNKGREIQPASERPLGSLQVVAPWKDDAPSTGSTDSGVPQNYPSLSPTGHSRANYTAHISPPEETVVTINIGRIEVKAEQPAEPARRQRHKFSPALSLADYLKQRSEGRMG